MLRKKADLALFQQNFQILFLSLSDFPLFRIKCYGRTHSTEATTELLKVQASDRYRRLPHVFTVTQPRLQFPFWKWEMSKKFQSPSCLKHCSFDFPAPVVRKAVGAYAQDDARPGGEIGDVFPKCGIARRETYFGATWSWQRPSFGYLASLWHQIHISGNLWKRWRQFLLNFQIVKKWTQGRNEANT